jgi:hypothetical protein
LDADLVGIDQFSPLGAVRLLDSGAVLGDPRVPVAEQLQRPLDNFMGFWSGPELSGDATALGGSNFTNCSKSTTTLLRYRIDTIDFLRSPNRAHMVLFPPTARSPSREDPTVRTALTVATGWSEE